MPAPAFTTRDACKRWLKIPLTDLGDDDIFDDLIIQVTASFQREMSRTIFQTTFQETYNGTGQPRLALKNYPITAVNSLTIDSVPVLPATSPSSSGFLFDEFGLYLPLGRFTYANQNVTVNYVAGFSASDVPTDLQLAAKQQVGFEYRKRDRIGERSKVLGAAQTVSYITDEFLPEVRRTLDRFGKKTPT